jgi:hypothetical protein
MAEDHVNDAHAHRLFHANVDSTDLAYAAGRSPHPAAFDRRKARRTTGEG